MLVVFPNHILCFDIDFRYVSTQETWGNEGGLTYHVCVLFFETLNALNLRHGVFLETLGASLLRLGVFLETRSMLNLRREVFLYSRSV